MALAGNYDEDSAVAAAAAAAWDRCLASASAATDILRSLAEEDLVSALPPER